MRDERILPKGQQVILSQKGHKDFYYPSTESETLVEDTAYEHLSYAGSSEMQAIKIPTNSVYVNSSENKYMVVWVDKEIVRAS